MQTFPEQSATIFPRGENMLSEKIHELRRKSGLSQEELADKLNVSRQAISKWELGSAVPTADKLVDIADFFGVSLDFLMRDLSEIPVSEISEKPENRTPEVHEKPHTARKITAFLLIATAVAMFAMITALYANQELRLHLRHVQLMQLNSVDTGMSISTSIS